MCVTIESQKKTFWKEKKKQWKLAQSEECILCTSINKLSNSWYISLYSHCAFMLIESLNRSWYFQLFVGYQNTFCWFYYWKMNILPPNDSDLSRRKMKHFNPFDEHDLHTYRNHAEKRKNNSGMRKYCAGRQFSPFIFLNK